MTTTALARVSLAEALWMPTSPALRRLRAVALVLGGSALLALSARIQIPFRPVPMTLQSLAVILLATAYGWRLGTATVLAYLAQGAAGLPVFAGGGGIAWLAGPTGGYLLGFVPAAALCGWMGELGLDRRPATALLTLAAGKAVIFLCGLGWLASFVGLSAALWTGFVLLLPAMALKLALGAALLPLVRSRIEREARA